MMKLNKYAEHFIKLELMKAEIEVFQNESGRKGLDFIIKTDEGNYHEIYLQCINLEKESSIKILKEDLKEPKENLWISLVLIMKNMDCSFYLIPSTIFLKPKGYTFLAKNNPKQSYWGINVFLEAIPELSKFSLQNVIGQL